ncbi:NYN domain-containing protein [Isoptericola sp. b441]|uniref:NYN domain-containing protein n=1 Tax=Actinotalea lenta TaxID=3064654 RepID=A0ABT9DC32_9CELL|nr:MULTISPECIES: NYN domain-containing protein [unclassified Isoptericola]MDO8106856.1 NYN domain-containing protein [Isoptericola sp. b441]MDO8121434.1 NYN domain-containing protein [Isoptericola sp. b490]
MAEETETRRVRCALFVDFDNVYIGLQRLDREAAEAFAVSPAHWLSALEAGSDADGEFTRRFLVRSCYLNPAAFSQFRPNFTRAGFSVVDCPSLTQQGKSSADINLVLDAVDALAASTRYDEFVIVSADADFTPLALRCRASDRRVTIVTAGPAASAYRAVADAVITADELVELVREPAVPEPEEEAAPRASGRKDAPSPARRAVLRQVRTADRPLTGGAVAQAAQKADPALSGSDWGGAGGFFDWLAAVVPELGTATKPSPGWVWDPKRFSEADLPGADGVDLPPLQRQVVEVTDIPNLPTERYGVLLRELAKDVRSRPFERAETARRVRDACQAAGEAIGRASVNAVIAGVLYSGLDLSTKPTVAQLAQTWTDYVVGLCRGARMELSPQDESAIRAWVGGARR